MRVETRLEPVDQAMVVTIRVPMLDTFFVLRTDWSSGRIAARTWTIDDAPPDADIAIQVAGTQHAVRTDASGTARFAWDGLDASGAPAGPATAVATVDGSALQRRLGRWDPLAAGLGGLMIHTDDHLDVSQRRIHTADGRLRGRIPFRRDGDGYLVSKSRGRVLSRFDAHGSLTRVIAAQSGETLRSFTRDEHGLVSISAGNRHLVVTRQDERITIARDSWPLDVPTGEHGRALGLTDPSGRGVSLRYDDLGLLVGVTDASGFDHRFEYDDAGRLVTVQAPGEGPMRLVRTSTEHGHRVTVLTTEGREFSYQTDRLPDGGIVRTTRCCGDRPTVTRIDQARITVERPDGTRIVNDRSTGERQITHPGSATRTRSVHDGTISVNGRQFEIERDHSGERVTSPLGREFRLEETEHGLRVHRPDGITEFVHDDQGRVIRLISGGMTLDAAYDEHGLPAQIRWSDGGSTRFEHDTSGWLIAQLLSGGRVIRLERDGAGLVRAVTTPGGGTTRFDFDAPGRLVSVRFPAPSGEDDRIDFDYDDDGYVVGRAVSGLDPVRYQRGVGGELETITWGDEIATVEHAHGRFASGRTADGQVTRVDRDGPLVTEIAYEGPVTGHVRYGRNADQTRSRIGSGELSAAVVHDDDGLVSSIGTATIYRDHPGRVTALTAGTVRQSFHYSDSGRLVRMDLVAGETELWTVIYEHDDAGRIARLTDSRLPSPVDYSYDAAHRLVRATGSRDDTTITYDDNGNPTRIERNGSPVFTTIDAGDRLVALGSTEIGYGPGGRIASIDDTQIVRGATGRVVALEQSGRRTLVRRDVLGALVALEPEDGPAQRFVCGYHGRPEVVVDEHGVPRLLLAGVTASTTPLLAISEDRTLFVASDHVGSVRLVVDTSTGEVVEARDYDAWGHRVHHEGASEVPFGFAGGIDDASTGLVHFPARTYSPTLMRWLRRDPELFLGGGANLYSYANSDPVNHRDPSGRKVEVCRAPTNMLPSWAPGGDTQEHWWLRTDDAEAGMGYDPTTTHEVVPSVVVEDHEGAAENNDYPCDEVEDIDEECVNEHLQTNKKSKGGKDYGDWLGFYGPGNTCQNFVKDVLEACSGGEYSIETSDPDAYDNFYSPDVNTHAPDGDATAGDATEGGGSEGDGSEQSYTPAGDHTPDPGMSSEDGGSLWE